MKRRMMSSSALIAIIAGSLLAGCGGGGDDGGIDSAINTGDTEVITFDINPGTDPDLDPPETNSTFIGTKLACTPVNRTISDATQVDLGYQDVNKTNVSTPTGSFTQDNRENATGNNTLKRLSVLVPATSRSGESALDGNLTHPLILSYTQQVVGEYEQGDGSADVPDPYQRDGLFVAVSYDNGATWNNKQLSHSEDSSSIKVVWDGATIDYKGHVQKPSMAVQGNNILIAYNDKFCPSRDPLDLIPNDSEVNASTFDGDYFGTIGNQGTIDYEGIQALPNDKYVYEAPFSCVWTVRGVFTEYPDDGDPTTPDYGIEWHKPIQLTSGMRDSNHIKIAAAKDAGFALAWQEDTEGLRAGKGAGPGEGWSGATTNHGTDIWYTSIKWDDFNLTELDSTDPNYNENNITSAVNFNYPVRITDNEICAPEDKKMYCEKLCEKIGTADINTTMNNKTDSVTRCVSYDYDWLLEGDDDGVLEETDETRAILDGDTGASRPTLNILKTDATEDEFIVLLGYEETKGLTERNTTGEPDIKDNEADTDYTTDIEVEGKSVYFESFRFDAIDDFNRTDPEALFKVAMPLVSAGDILNIKVPQVLDPYAETPVVDDTNMIYENARRLVVGTQVDSCDADKYTFAVLYKQSFDTQGASSDMFVRVNTGFTYDSFTALDGRIVTNVSAQDANLTLEDSGTASDYIEPVWSEENLDAQTYDNPYENTFSPRIFLRGNIIYTGYAYTPSDKKTVAGNMPSNFHTSIYNGTDWVGPDNVSKIIQGSITSEDPRFIPTPKAVAEGLPSDASNPNVLWVSWGTINTNEHIPEGIYFKRGIFDGTEVIWDTNATKLADRQNVEESAVQVLATPDGKTLHNVWIQETATYDPTDPFSGLDTWYGRVDINDTL